MQKPDGAGLFAAFALQSIIFMKKNCNPGCDGILALGINEARADTFGTGGNSFTVDFTTIGNPANAADTTGAPNPAGSVSYTYRIGTYKVSPDMIEKANAALPTLGDTNFRGSLI